MYSGLNYLRRFAPNFSAIAGPLLGLNPLNYWRRLYCVAVPIGSFLIFYPFSKLAVNYFENMRFIEGDFLAQTPETIIPWILVNYPEASVVISTAILTWYFTMIYNIIINGRK